MAAKAGDNPDSLMTLATVYCLRNLRRTMCYQGFRNKLCLRSDIFLPSEICDKLVNTYVTGQVSLIFLWENNWFTFVMPFALPKQIYGVGAHRQQLRTGRKLLPAFLRPSEHQTD